MMADEEFLQLAWSNHFGKHIVEHDAIFCMVALVAMIAIVFGRFGVPFWHLVRPFGRFDSDNVVDVFFYRLRNTLGSFFLSRKW